MPMQDMRTIEYRYDVEGHLEELVCRNGTVEEVTRWEYGADLNEDSTGIPRAEKRRITCTRNQCPSTSARGPDDRPDGSAESCQYSYGVYIERSAVGAKAACSCLQCSTVVDLQKLSRFIS
jgi:hypothetical protein